MALEVHGEHCKPASLPRMHKQHLPDNTVSAVRSQAKCLKAGRHKWLRKSHSDSTRQTSPAVASSVACTVQLSVSQGLAVSLQTKPHGRPGHSPVAWDASASPAWHPRLQSCSSTRPPAAVLGPASLPAPSSWPRPQPPAPSAELAPAGAKEAARVSRSAGECQNCKTGSLECSWARSCTHHMS